MSQKTDKREHSTKPDVDDLTSYESENILGGAGVLTDPDEVRPPTNNDERQAGTIEPPLVEKETDAPIESGGDYNDGLDFSIVDDENKTNV